MPTESDDRDVNEGDDTEETGGSSKNRTLIWRMQQHTQSEIAKRQKLCFNI